MRVKKQALSSFLSSRAFHLVVLGLGTLFLLTDAFHGNVWFDETYSVAISNHGFADIWTIGSGDVHPVLFYWGLHVFNLIFGQNVLVYRLFALAGAVALGVLGYTHVRRDFGWRAGVLFSFFALFTPYVAVMAVEIRMYSWATFTVMLCALTAWRIFVALRAGSRVPVGRWAVFFLASLASAYLHYFGVLSAFVINVMLFAYLVRCAVKQRESRPSLGVFLAGALVQVLLYAPWLVALTSQVGVVSQTYWANIVFPTTYIELATYPLMTSQISFAARGSYGVVPQVVLWALWIAALLLLAFALVRFGRKTHKGMQDKKKCAALNAGAGEHHEMFAPDKTSNGEAIGSKTADGVHKSWWHRFSCWLTSEHVLPVACALGVYLGVFAIGLAASYLMNSLILYYRYLFIAIGPLLFALALVFSRVTSRAIVGGVCVLLLGTSLVNQTLLVYDDYSSDNQAPLEQFAKLAPEVDLIVSSDIGIEGVTAVTYRDIPQTYMDWQKGNWGQAYQAYAPTLTSKKSWELILDDFHGRFMVLGQAQTAAEPRDVYDLRQKQGITLVESKTYYRPYERTYFTIAIMEKV